MQNFGDHWEPEDDVSFGFIAKYDVREIRWQNEQLVIPRNGQDVFDALATGLNQGKTCTLRLVHHHKSGLDFLSDEFVDEHTGAEIEILQGSLNWGAVESLDIDDIVVSVETNGVFEEYCGRNYRITHFTLGGDARYRPFTEATLEKLQAMCADSFCRVEEKFEKFSGI